MNIHLLVWGNKRGQKVFYNNAPFVIDSCIEDPTTYISIHEPKIKYYSIDSIKDDIVYTSYVSIFDWDIRARCVLAISVIINRKYKIGGEKNLLNLLDELTSKYLTLYLDTITNSIKKINEDWSIFENIASQYQVEMIAQPKSITLNEHVSNYAVIKYNNDTDIKDYLENPYREQYKDFKEIYFISAGQQEIIAAPQLTDLTHSVPPREKSYEIKLLPKATQVGATLPKLETLNIDFRVNRQLVNINNAEVYKGDEISIIVNHPSFEFIEKTYTIGDSSINGDKVYLEIPLTYRPKTVKISIVDDKNQPISQDVEVTISDSKGKYEKLKPNYQGLYDVQVSYGDDKFYGVTSSDYDATNGNGRIDFRKDEITVSLKRKEVPKALIGSTVNQGGQSGKGKYSPGDQIDLDGGSSFTKTTEINIGFWTKLLDRIRIGKIGIAIILAMVFIGSLLAFGYYQLKYKPNKEKNKQISDLFKIVYDDSIAISNWKSPYDSSTLERYIQKHDSIKVKIETFKVDSLNKKYTSNLKKLEELRGEIAKQKTKIDDAGKVAEGVTKEENVVLQNLPPANIPKEVNTKVTNKIKDQFVTENAIMQMTNSKDGKQRIDNLDKYLKKYDFGNDLKKYKELLNSLKYIYDKVNEQKNNNKNNDNDDSFKPFCTGLGTDEKVNKEHQNLLKNKEINNKFLNKLIENKNK